MRTSKKRELEAEKLQLKKKKLLDDESEDNSENYLESEDEEIQCFDNADEEEGDLEIDIEKLLQRGELEMKEKEALIENRIKQFEQEKL